MDIFDQYAEKITAQLKNNTLLKLPQSGGLWPETEKNPFIMERETAVELGGYPKESINLMISSSNFDFVEKDGLWLIGDPKALYGKDKHLSFGKVVLLKCKDVNSEETYDYLKSVEFSDMRQHFFDVMVRMSTQKQFTNLRISKKAMKKGFTIDRLGWSMLQSFLALPQVEQVKIILILGDSPLYKELLPVAEKIRDVTSALNTMFDGIDFDCQSCKLNGICEEVEGLKKVHKASRSMV
ncbi:hypothetical protein KR505_11765 [Eubacterium callanderi]|uniref:hypothetical protein n=1 Tax=Eubacterium callanderi TaxID=53442 RepID=UPI001C2D379D|nr:hypothetical protein [Eubacterium callanderi]MBV1684079.1 hypothetical protein [Eubacterium callanderi]